MITVVKEFSFEAAHYLPGYKGACANLHGHSYRLLVGVFGEINPETGMIIDFKTLKKMVQPIVDLLDLSYLNKVSTYGFPYFMPTAENMIEWIRDRLVNYYVFDEHGPLESEFTRLRNLSFIRLYETANSYAEWRA